MSLQIVLSLICTLGYAFIIFEHTTRINKTSVALSMGSICWILFFINHPEDLTSTVFYRQITELAEIIFFLLGAMTIVEVIDSHGGFQSVTSLLHSTSKYFLLWKFIVLSFFMSSVLDNLTTMIVMTSIIKRMLTNPIDRWRVGSVVLIAVNAGGAWTPIGDVTTTMIWIGGKISSLGVMKYTVLPSIVNVLIVGIIVSFLMYKQRSEVKINQISDENTNQTHARVMLTLGISALLSIPIMHTVFHTPPFIGVLLGLGIMWIVTDMLGIQSKNDKSFSMTSALAKIDISTLLFFVGILLSIDVLSLTGVLNKIQLLISQYTSSPLQISYVLGIISSILDNVPLVSGMLNMYSHIAKDSHFWFLTSYAAGTGGSLTIIGSSAGITFMGLEKVDFFWFLKKITPIALLGYTMGFVSYAIQWYIASKL